MDAQRAVLEPLIEACQPHQTALHEDLRQTVKAIICRCQPGAKWRAIPVEWGSLLPRLKANQPSVQDAAAGGGDSVPVRS